MSIEAAKAIAERMNNDQEYVAKLVTCKTFDELQQVFAQEGLEVTNQELTDQLKTLTDDDLEQVAGGGQRSCGQLFYNGVKYVLCDLMTLAK